MIALSALLMLAAAAIGVWLIASPTTNPRPNRKARP